MSTLSPLPNVHDSLTSGKMCEVEMPWAAPTFESFPSCHRQSLCTLLPQLCELLQGDSWSRCSRWSRWSCCCWLPDRWVCWVCCLWHTLPTALLTALLTAFQRFQPFYLPLVTWPTWAPWAPLQPFVSWAGAEAWTAAWLCLWPLHLEYRNPLIASLDQSQEVANNFVLAEALSFPLLPAGFLEITAPWPHHQTLLALHLTVVGKSSSLAFLSRPSQSACAYQDAQAMTISCIDFVLTSCQGTVRERYPEVQRSSWRLKSMSQLFDMTNPAALLRQKRTFCPFLRPLPFLSHQLHQLHQLPSLSPGSPLWNRPQSVAVATLLQLHPDP